MSKETQTPLTQEEIDILQTDILTLCKRIKDAYEEGLFDKQWNQEVSIKEVQWTSGKNLLTLTFRTINSFLVLHVCLLISLETK